MPKQLLAEARNDFRGGLNVYISPDLLAPNEVLVATNYRIDTNGPAVRRSGTRRLHQTALAAAAIKGITQWDGPSGSQIVAICNGDLFYRNQSGGEYSAFTQVDPGTTDAFSTSSPATFTTLRGTASGAPLYLYIASGGKLYQWTGTTLTRIDMEALNATGQFGPDASLIATYHLRLFTNTLVRPQHVVWSRLADGTNFKGGLAGDGGTAIVNAIEADSIVALKTIGRSLLVATKNNIARIAGYSAEDIRIDQDTESLSPSVGVVGSQAICRADRLVFFVAQKGCYLASEDAITPVSLKVQPIFDAMDRAQLANIVVGYHASRSEIWVAYAGPDDSSLNKSVLVFNLRHQAWYGPFNMQFNSSTAGITSMTPYEDPNGDNFLIAGCSDGFVRHLDYGLKDDLLYDNSGGSDISGLLTLAPFLFGSPENVVALKYVVTQAKVNAQNCLSFFARTAPGIGTIQSIIGTLFNPLVDSTLVSSYRGFPTDDRLIGPRLLISYVNLPSAETQLSEIHGVTVYAYNMTRTIGGTPS